MFAVLKVLCRPEDACEPKETCGPLDVCVPNEACRPKVLDFEDLEACRLFKAQTEDKIRTEKIVITCFCIFSSF